MKLILSLEQILSAPYGEFGQNWDERLCFFRDMIFDTDRY